MTEEMFALNGEYSCFACKENAIEDKLKIVVTAVGFCSTSAIKKRPAMKKTGYFGYAGDYITQLCGDYNKPL